MTSVIKLEEYAFLSDLVYNGKRTKDNQLKIDYLDGWEEVKYISDNHDDEDNENKTEFAAGVYQKGDNIVIAFCGTNADMEEHINTNVPSGMGIPNEQVFEALKLTVETIRNNPDKNIIFTGHSLGGGLASIMSVFFDIEAVVFDQAPFEDSAIKPDSVFCYVNYLMDECNYTLDQIPQAFIDYCNDTAAGTTWQNIRITPDLVATVKYLEKLEIAVPEELSDLYYLLVRAGEKIGSYSERESNVTNYYLEGEILSKLRLLVPAICGDGQDNIVELGGQSASSVDLHLMPLFTAVMLSESFKKAVANNKFSAEVFYNASLYGYDYKRDENANFLIKMVQNHFLNKDSDWLGVIAKDLNKIVDDESIMDDKLVQGLLASLTEYWYFNNDANKTAFSQLRNGVQVDFSLFSSNSDSVGRNKLVGALYRQLGLTDFYPSYPKGTLGYYYGLKNPTIQLKDANLFNVGYYGESFGTNSSNNNQNTFVWGYQSSHVVAETGAGNDTLIGSAKGSNNLSGGGGDDLIISDSDATSILDGGSGNDIIYSYGKGKAEIKGGEGNDVIYAYGDNSEIDGGANNDTIYSYGKNSNINGGDNNDTIYSYGDNAKIDGGEGNDYIVVKGKGSVATGGKGNDTLVGGEGVDVLDGGEGIDEYHAGDGDVIFDSDGQGKIFLNGKLLSHAVLVEGKNNSYTDSQGNTYTFEGTTLVVNGTLRIDSFLEPGMRPDNLGYTYTKMGITIYSPNQSSSQPIDIEYEKIEATDKEGEYIQGHDATKNYDLIGAEGDDTLVGNNGYDFLYGGKGDDLLQGGKGNDTLIGGEGSNRLFGGEGNDKLYAEEQIELDPEWGNKGSAGSKGKGSLLTGGEGNDTIVGSTKDDLIYAEKGNNFIYAGEGNDIVYLDREVTSTTKDWSIERKYNGDFYYYDTKEIFYQYAYDKNAINTVYLGAGDDYIVGGGGFDIIDAGIGDDTIYAGHGHNLLLGGDGDDVIYGDTYKRQDNSGWYNFISTDIEGLGYGNDTIDGGDGSDSILGGGGDDVIYGGKGNDVLYGDHKDILSTDAKHFGNDYIDGGDGDDDINGGLGDDTLLGGAGNDIIEGDDGTIDIALHGDDYIDGGDGDDKIWGRGGKDTILGGAGKDTIYAGAGDDIAYGEAGNDYMLGDDDEEQAGHDYLDGGDGDDSIWGLGGNDTLYGGAGNDYLDGGSGDNYLYGGEGNDTLNAAGSVENDQSRHGNNYLDGGEGNDMLISGSKSDTLMGGEGHDQLIQFVISDNPEEDNDYLDGGTGNDTLVALSGNNTLIGGAGNDLLVSDLNHNFQDIGVVANDLLDGGEGNDFLISAGGQDTLYGGTGNDTYSIFLKNGNTVTLYEETDNTDNNEDHVILNNISFLDKNTKLSFQGGALVIETADGKVVLNNYLQFEYLQFSEGSIATKDLTLTDIGGAVIIRNHDPIAQGELQEQKIEAGAQWQWTLPNGSFTDADIKFGDFLTYEATLIDGSPLPDWLEFDPVTGKFNGSAPNDTGVFNIVITAYDKTGSSASHNLTINIIPASPERITGTDGDDLIYGKASNDTIYGLGGNDTIYTGVGVDYIDGGDGDDLIFVGEGWTTVYGGKGNDTYISGGGYDNFYDQEGDDVYYFGSDWKENNIGGSKRTNINDIQGNNIIKFETGINQDDIAIYRQGDTLYLTPVGKRKQGDGTIVLGDFFKNYNYSIQWGDGTTLTAEQLKQLVLQGTSIGEDLLQGYDEDEYIEGKGRDTVYGGAGNDTLVSYMGNYLYGESGNDLLIVKEGFLYNYLDGGSGNDIYFIEGIIDNTIKSRNIVINNNDKEGTDIIKLAEGINPNDFYLFKQNDGSLKLAFKVDKYDRDTINIKGYFSQQEGNIEGILFANGTFWDRNYIESHLDMDEDQIFYSLSDGNVLQGGNGNDYFVVRECRADIIGGNGTNRYFITFSGSQITASNIGKDELQFGSNGNIILTKVGNDLRVKFADASNLVIIKNHFTTNPIGYINDVSVNELINQIGLTYEGVTNITGDANDNFIIADYSANVIRGMAGNDTLEGGRGNDSLDGGADQDTYLFRKGDGNDTITTGESGLDIIKFKDIRTTDIRAVRRSGNNLIIEYGNNDSITINNHFTTGAVGYIKFSNTQIMTIEELLTEYVNGVTLTAGNDTVTFGEGNDLVYADDGNDRITGGSGNDTIYGQTGNDTLNGGIGDDYLDGGIGNDQLNGDAGNDILVGGQGDDILNGGIGADTYVFQLGDGQDTINTSDSGIDTIKFEDITIDQIRNISRTGNNLIIEYGYNDKITITNHFTTAAVGYIAFGNNQSISLQDFINNQWGGIKLTTAADTITFSNGDNLIYAGAGNDRITAGTGNDTLYGEAGNDSLVGGAGDDLLIGGIGNDTLNGGKGADIYLFNKGDGTDIINTGDSGVDTIRFEDITIDQIRSINRTGNNLIIEYGDNDKITVTNHFTTAAVGYIAFGNNQSISLQDFINNQWGGIKLTTAADTMTFSNGNNLIYAGAGNDRITAGAGNDTLYGEAGNDSLVGGAGDDLLIGGIGNDTLNGGEGADIYLFNKGDGTDIINTGDSGVDIIRFEDITIDQIRSINRTGNNLIIEYGDNDKITVTNHFTTAAVGYIAFGNNQPINLQDFINNQWGGIKLTTAADTMTFNNGDNLIYAGAGNDRITAGAGNDTLYGEAGNDSLVGGAGDDLLIGGIGNDTLNGGTGNDTYLFARGDGQDQINNDSTTWQQDNDKLLFQDGVAADQLWFQKSGNNLIVSIIGTSDKVTINNWYRGDQYKLDSFELANGEALLASQVDNLVNAMASFSVPKSGQTTLSEEYQSKLNDIIAVGWN